MSRLIDRLNGVELAGEIVRRGDLRSHVPRSAPHPPPPSQPEFLSILLDLLQRRKRTILGFFLLVVLLVAAASFLMKPKYEAVARIVFNRENANPLAFKDLGDMPHDDSEYSVSLDTQVQVLQSDTLATQVIRDLHLDQSAAFGGTRALPQPATTASARSEFEARKAQEKLLRMFVNGLSISKTKNTRVIEIRYKSKDPKLSADIANAVTQAYIEHNFKMRFQSTMQTSNWLTLQLAELATKVQDSQQKLVDYQKEHGFLQLDEKQNVVTTRLDDLNRELTAAQADRINKESSYRLTLAENAELTSKAEPNALIDKLNAQEASLKTEYAQATVQLGPSNPKVQELGNQLKETQNEINSELHKMSDRVRTQYFEAQARERMIRAAVEEQKQQANKLSESAIDYSLLKRDAESNRQLYEGLLQKLKEAGVSAGMRSSNIEVVDVAEVPAVPSEPNIPRNLIMAALLGMLGGIGLAFIQEKFDRTVRSFHQVQVLSSLPQLGIIPLASGNGSQLAASPQLSLGSSAPAGGSVDLIVNSDPMSPIAESYRALVNSILFSAPVPPRIILVTSAITGDGKTSTSINVAIVLAKQGKRVLLVDADLRRPSIHKAMRLPVTEGLSTILRSRNDLSGRGSALTSESVPVPAPGIPNLFVMPAGPLDAEPAELVGSKAMQELLQEWNTQFDHVIVDSSPVVLVSDAVRLSVAADSVILVVRWGHTPQEAFARAQELLTQVNAAVMGVVFNGADLTSPALSYYGQYGYDSYPQQLNRTGKN
jgi:polysaccharide biosynthesis transport protein